MKRRCFPKLTHFVALTILLFMTANALAQISGPTPVGAGSTYTYSFNNGSIISPKWIFSNGTMGSKWSSGTTYYVSISWATTGTTSLSVQDLNSGNVLSSKSITINSCTTITAPVANNGSRCGVGTVDISTNAPLSGYSERWYAADGSTNVFTDNVNYYTTPVISVTTTYYATFVKNTTGCESSKTLVTATVVAAPTTSVAGNNQTICTNSFATLTANNPTVGTGLWSVSGPSNATSQFSNLTSPTSKFTPAGGVGVYTLTWTISSSSCTSSSSLSITTNTPGTTAIAGQDQIGASTCGLTQVTLGANSPTLGTGSWSIANDSPTRTGGSFGNSLSSVSSFSGTPGSTYNLVWSITNGACISSSEIYVKLNQNPSSALAGSNQVIWGSSGRVTLTASSPMVGIGSWSIPDGPSTSASQLSSLTDPQATLTPAGGQGVYRLTWTISNAPCQPVSSNVSIAMKALPQIVASSSNIVKGGTATLDAGIGYDSYVWTNSTGTVVSNSRTLSTQNVDTYQVVVSLLNISSPTNISPTYTLQPQMSGLQMNYIINNSVLVPNVMDQSTLDNLPVDQVNQTVQYFDGLGRPIQSVVTQGSPLKADIIVPNYYDKFSREIRKYLPVVAGNNGRYKDDFIDANGNLAGTALDFYNKMNDKIADDVRPFSETVFENSPLSRPLKDYGPGVGWNTTNVVPTPSPIVDKPITHAYLINDATTEQIFAFTIDPASGLPVVSPDKSTVINGFYTSGQLTIKSTIDEEGHEVREYTDILGHVVLKKVQAVAQPSLNNNAHWAQTYYIYDALGRLSFVLSPEAVRSLTN